MGEILLVLSGFLSVPFCEQFGLIYLVSYNCAIFGFSYLGSSMWTVIWAPHCEKFGLFYLGSSLWEIWIVLSGLLWVPPCGKFRSFYLGSFGFLLVGTLGCFIWVPLGPSLWEIWVVLSGFVWVPSFGKFGLSYFGSFGFLLVGNLVVLSVFSRVLPCGEIPRDIAYFFEIIIWVPLVPPCRKMAYCLK